MLKTAVALGLAGFAAAGGASLLVRAPSAAPLAARSAAGRCSPGKIGQVVRVTNTVRINGTIPLQKKSSLKNGDWLRTDADGTAQLCLKQGSALCAVAADSIVRIRPAKTPTGLVRVTRGEMTCGYNRTQLAYDSDGNGMLLRVVTRLRLTAATTADGGAVVSSVSVRKGEAVVKLRRGTAVVTSRGDLATAVVVGRDQKVVVPAGGPPAAVTGIGKVKPAEQRAFKQVEKALPKDTDRSAPTVGITSAPRAKSSLRSATFTFTATETGSTFSCALDDSEDFRLCTSPQQYANIAPGAHRFKVRATDLAGNTGPAAIQPWENFGSTIAFASDRDSDPGLPNTEIYVMDPDGGGQTRLTVSPGVDEDPEWSPDFKQIAFHSSRDTKSTERANVEIYVMNADGSAQRRLTTDPAIDRNPSWSPDGKRIVFESERDGNRDLYTMNADGSDVRRLTNDPQEDFDPAWSPDGKWIAFASTRDVNAAIYRMNADGTGLVRLTPDRAQEFGPTWSPDGTKIAFNSTRAGNPDIWVMNNDGGNPHALTESPFLDHNPAWSADGDWIVFQTVRDDNPRIEIYRMKADGNDETRLTKRPNNFVPDW